MSVQEIIDEFNLTVMGYAGYISSDERQDTVDVFEAWVDGRLSKKKETLVELQRTWKSSDEDKDKAVALEKILELLEKILLHSKYDSEKIKPFLSEHSIIYKEIAYDITRLDKHLHSLEEQFCKKLENVSAIDAAVLEEADVLATDLLKVMREKTKRVDGLNKLFFIVQKNIKQICKSINEISDINADLFKKIDVIMEKFPKRIATFENVLTAFKTARPFYQNYEDKNILKMKQDIFKLYLEKYPQLLKKSTTMIEDFSATCDAEKKSLEKLQKAIENPPDFEKLNQKLDQALTALNAGGE